jgi:hypothetical protein
MVSLWLPPVHENLSSSFFFNEEELLAVLAQMRADAIDHVDLSRCMPDSRTGFNDAEFFAVVLS